MTLPFTQEQFLNVFKEYNESVFPAQIIFYITALVCLYLIYKNKTNSSKITSLFISFLWVWSGIVYHILYFSEINKPAILFGILFIAQGTLLFYSGFIKNRFKFEFRYDINSIAGAFIIFYSLVLYPLLGYFASHQYPYCPTFGLPCPITIFTFGLFLMNTKRIRMIHYIIPTIWVVIAVNAAIFFSIYEDYGLLLSCIIFYILRTIENKNLRVKTI